jgi:hypothetical protein
MMIRVFDEQGIEVDLKPLGLNGLRLIIPSLGRRTTSEVINGRAGVIEFDEGYDSRDLIAEMYFESFDGLDYVLLRDQLYKLFDTKKMFYIMDSRQSGKRWSVRTKEQWTPERLNGITGRFTINLICADGFAESIGTTQDPMIFDSDLWQFGQGWTLEDVAYTHSTSSFRIFNAGDVPINPCEHPLVISFKGASSNLLIRNLTTGDVWSYNGSTIATDEIKLDGIKSLKNDVSIFGQTNFKLLTIETGWNDFVIEGASSPFTIDFDFRFYYL